MKRTWAQATTPDATRATAAGAAGHRRRNLFWRACLLGQRAQSLYADEDPLLGQMRREGTLMPHRWCNNGSLVPAELSASPIDPIWGPMWMADDEEEALEGLVNGTALATAQLAAQASNWPMACLLLPALRLLRQAWAWPLFSALERPYVHGVALPSRLPHARAQLPVPALMLFMRALNLSDAALPGDRSAEGALPLVAPLMLSGPLDNAVLLPRGAPNAGGPPHALLDLSGRTRPVWRVVDPAGQLLLVNLVSIVWVDAFAFLHGHGVMAGRASCCSSGEQRVGVFICAKNLRPCAVAAPLQRKRV